MLKTDEKKLTQESIRFLEFQLSEQTYAVELNKVREVIPPPDCTPVPKAPKFICGVMNLRGTVLTVIDLRQKMSIKPLENQAEAAVIIFELNGVFIGALVDRINKVANYELTKIQSICKSETDCYSIRGVLKSEDRITMWIDLDQIVENIASPANAA
jgi:purine-binding chemotaxis protein CheW